MASFGEARTDIDPEGKVFVQGELWNAHAPSRVQMGEPVVVRKVEGLELEVEKSRVEAECPAASRAATDALVSRLIAGCDALPLLPNWVTPSHKPTIISGHTFYTLLWQRRLLVNLFVIIPVVIIVLYLLNSIKILAEYERGVIFRLGRLLGTRRGRA